MQVMNNALTLVLTKDNKCISNWVSLSPVCSLRYRSRGGYIAVPGLPHPVKTDKIGRAHV